MKLLVSMEINEKECKKNNTNALNAWEYIWRFKQGCAKWHQLSSNFEKHRGKEKSTGCNTTHGEMPSCIACRVFSFSQQGVGVITHFFLQVANTRHYVVWEKQSVNQGSRPQKGILMSRYIQCLEWGPIQSRSQQELGTIWWFTMGGVNKKGVNYRFPPSILLLCLLGLDLQNSLPPSFWGPQNPGGGGLWKGAIPKHTNRGKKRCASFCPAASRRTW